jgi:5-hydroxyisourate hydrolase-like protein (transthyretin family)
MVPRPGFIGYLLLALLVVLSLRGQTTQGLISGHVIDSEDGTPLSACQVLYLNLATNTTGTVNTDAGGRYLIPLLPPGDYQIRIEKDKYQAQTLQKLILPVASALEINFQLRPLSDVWEQGQYRSVFLPGSRTVLTFFGPDVDPGKATAFEANSGRKAPLDTSVSEVIDPRQVQDLPLAGRDVYATLVLQPGVTADSGTARGLGLAVNGQRPTASNYLLDGLENNNYLITGPLTTVAPEAVQEYRVSTSGFSAEYGRTSGFIANAVTRSGGNSLHGIGYFNLKNDALNANSFQRNLNDLPRTPLKEDQAGFQVGGPLRRNSLFYSLSFDALSSRSQNEPIFVALPTTSYVDSLPAGSTARTLLSRYAPPAVSSPDGAPFAIVAYNPPAVVDRYSGLERIDYVVPGGKHHIMARVAAGRVTQPDFIWSPYADFVSALGENTRGIAISVQSSLGPSLTNEARGSWSADKLQWGRAHTEIPTLYTIAEGVTLPGSPAAYGYSNNSRNWELLDNLVWVRGRHLIKFGGNFLIRNIDGALTAFRDGLYYFPNLNSFALDQPSLVRVALDRQALPTPQIPRYDHSYRYNQFSLFAQDSFRVSPRLAINFGVRYENYGAPSNVGAVKDATLQLGSGADFGQRLAGASLIYPGAGDQQLYDSDRNNWAGRFGFSYSLDAQARTLLRGGYGNYYDRPFDNLWQNLRNNNFVLAQSNLSGPIPYLSAPPNALPTLSRFKPIPDVPRLTYYQPAIRDGYVHSYFLGVQHSLTSALTIEVNGLGSAGRKLLVTDLVNRDDSQLVTPDTFLTNPTGRYNGSLPLISYRSNQGTSNYNALAVVGRYRGRRGQFQIAYTWSHTIDNQSEPLAGDFFNLDFTRAGANDARNVSAAFSRQFDSRVDRANSDFDQRHNLVFQSIWELPAPSWSAKAATLLRGWRVSQVAAIRSGFPFTVLGLSTPPDVGGNFQPNRANLIDPDNATSGQHAIPGGVQLLNSAAFAAPAAGALGNTGRNEFRGPGLFNIDLSLSKAVPLRWLGETGKLTVRADAFNILNHANLNNPANVFFGFPTPAGTPGFGQAFFGRTGVNTGFPAQTPFNETPRQVQLLFRVEF